MVTSGEMVYVYSESHTANWRVGRDRDRMGVGFTTTCVINAYHY